MLSGIEFILFSVVPVLQDLLIAVLFVRGIFLLKERKKNWNARIVSLDPFYLWFGTISGGIFSLPVTFPHQDQFPGDERWYFFEIFVLLGIAFLLSYCNYTITYDREIIERSNLFGVKENFAYEEITGIIRHDSGAVLCFGQKKIRLDASDRGRFDFIEYAEKAYGIRYKKAIPEYKPERDPMNGNVKDPWRYLVIDVVMFAGAIFLLCFAVTPYVLPVDRLPAHLLEIRTSFSSYEFTGEDSGTLVLHTESYKMPFKLSNLYGYEIPIPNPHTLCNGKDYILMVGEGKKEYNIYTISTSDNQPIIRAIDVNTAERNTAPAASFFLIFIGILMLLFGVFGVLVGRYPERYPEWLPRLLFREGDFLYSSEEKSKEKGN